MERRRCRTRSSSNSRTRLLARKRRILVGRPQVVGRPRPRRPVNRPVRVSSSSGRTMYMDTGRCVGWQEGRGRRRNGSPLHYTVYPGGWCILIVHEFFTFCIFASSIHNLLLYDAGAPRFQTVHGDMNGLCDEFAY